MMTRVIRIFSVVALFAHVMADVQSCSMKHNQDLDNKISQFWLIKDLEMKNLSSKLTCATICLFDPCCVTFMFEKTSRRCRLHAAKIGGNNQLISAPGFQTYDTGEDCRHYESEFTTFQHSSISLGIIQLLTKSMIVTTSGCAAACTFLKSFVCRAFYLDPLNLACTLLEDMPSMDPLTLLTSLLPLNVDLYKRKCLYDTQ